MVHSTPLRVFIEMTTQLTKYFCHFTKGEYTTPWPYWLEVTWRKNDLTWLDLKKIAMTWLDLRLQYFWLDLTWLVTRARVTCYNTVLMDVVIYIYFNYLWALFCLSSRHVVRLSTAYSSQPTDPGQSPHQGAGARQQLSQPGGPQEWGQKALCQEIIPRSTDR